MAEINKEQLGMPSEPETKEERENRERQEQKEVLDRVVRGVNDMFIKEYDFEDIGIKFTIKIQIPNAIETGKVHARMSLYLGGMNNYASEYYLVAYQALALLRVTGKDVPKELENDEDIYNLDVLYEIGRDFEQWLSQFRF